MPFIQPPVPPLPAGIDLSGKTVIVMGATEGIGLEICRQLLAHKLSTLVMAVRNVSKGESVRNTLLSEPDVASSSPAPVVKVMKLDAEDYASVQAFATAFKAEFSELHLLMGNAGIGTLVREVAKSGHEKNIQVNYLSNVLLTFSLLPALEAAAESSGEPSRVTWTGSRMHKHTSLADPRHQPLNQGESILTHLDAASGHFTTTRYSDTKLLVVLFQLELARRYPPTKVVVNNFCPGMVNPRMSDVLPAYLRLPMKAIMAIRARAPEKAGWIALNAAVVLGGGEAHGRCVEDMVVGEVFGWVGSEEGRRVRGMVWGETEGDGGVSKFA